MLILASRLITLVALVGLCLKVFPGLRASRMEWSLAQRLFRYGGWLTVIGVIDPFLAYSERFLIGTIISAAALGYYAVPSEGVLRLAFVPASLAMTLFPAFSALAGRQDRQRLGMLFARSVKYCLLVLGPIILLLILFADDLLSAWLGSDFASHSQRVLQLLAVGAFVNYLEYIPLNLLKGVGRPDIVAKLHLAELPIYLVLVWLATLTWGLVGTAAIWSARIAVDGVILFGAATLTGRFSASVFWRNGLVISALAFLALAATAVTVRGLASMLPVPVEWTLLSLTFGLFAFVGWTRLLDELDRTTVVRAVLVWRE
jgi:O-antigen/teichoic acid export membrane protein